MPDSLLAPILASYESTTYGTHVNTDKHVALERLADMAAQAGMDKDRAELYATGNRPGVTLAALARFAALVQADAEAEMHAAIDATGAQIIRNAREGYPGNREPRELTREERIAALGQYAADWKRWCMEAEAKAETARADALEQAAETCMALTRAYWNDTSEEERDYPDANEFAAAIRALKDAP